MDTGSTVVSMSNTNALPDVGRMRSSRVRIVVVLPAPLGPRKPKTSPAWTSRSTSTMPRCSPYDLVRRSVRMMAGMSVLSRGEADGRRRSAGLELVDGDVNDIDHDGVQLVDVTEPLQRGPIAIRQGGHRTLERVERRAERPLAILDRPDRAVVAHAPVVATVA